MKIIKQLQQTLILEPLSLFHASCTLLIVLLAYTYAQWQPSSESNWLILSSLLLSQAGLGAEIKWQALWQLLFYPLCGLISGLVVFGLSLAAGNFWCASVLILVVTGLSSFLGLLRGQFFVAAFVLNLLGLVAVFFPCDLVLAEQRFYLIVIASLVVFIVRCLFWLMCRRWGFFFARVRYFQKLKYVYQLIFYTAGLVPNIFGRELEESHFQIAWGDCLAAMQDLKKNLAPFSAGKNLMAHLERIWDLSLSLGSLRYRLTEDAIFKMGQREMQDLSQAINAILNKLTYSKRSWKTLPLGAFERAIQEFEELYQSMLQSIAKEPLVILLFIQDLYALKDELENLPSALHLMQLKTRAAS